MKLVMAVLLCGLAGALGLASGYLLRVTTHSAAPGEKGAGARTTVSVKGERRNAHRTEHHASLVSARVERSQGAHHWLQWMSGVESASLADLAGLARMAKDNPGALRLIAYRWLELDPEHFLETLKRESKVGGEDVFPVGRLARYLFEEWPKRDPGAAIAALAEPDSLVGLSGHRHTVLNVVFQQDPRRGLELMGEWNILHFGPNMDGLKKWAQRDPRAAAQAILDNPVGYGAESSMKALANVWGESDPEGALEFALQAAGNLGRKMRTTLLADWAGRDRAAAADWLAGQDDESVRAELGPVIVAAWAKEDPEAALAWCHGNLEGHRLVNAVEKLAEGAAAHDIRGAGELVARMAPSRARTQAAIAVGTKWFPSRYPSEQDVKPEAVAWIRSLDDPKLQGAVIESVAWAWSTQDRESLMDVLASPVGEGVPVSVYSHVMRTLARDDPHGALEWAAELPEGRVEEASMQAFSVWAQHRPVEALDWFLTLPAADARRPRMVRSMVLEWSYNPDLKTALERLGRLPAGDREIARAQIQRTGLPEEKKRLLLEALGK